MFASCLSFFQDSPAASDALCSFPVALQSSLAQRIQENPTQSIIVLILLILTSGFLYWWWYTQVRVAHKANARAEQLLREQLPPAQYQQLQQTGYIELPSQVDKNRYYRIPRKRRRIQVLQTAQQGTTRLYRVWAELCVIVPEPVPDADVVLAHKWMIEGDESTYLRMANWITVGGGVWHIHSP